MNPHDMPQLITPPSNVEAEQSVIGALLMDNDAVDRITDLKAEHFYRHEHREIFAEILRQISTGKSCDIISVFDALRDSHQDLLPYLTSMQSNTPSAANISRYAEIVIDRALKRSLIALSWEVQEHALGAESAVGVLDKAATKIEELAQKKTAKDPKKIGDMLERYVDLLQARMEGRVQPIRTGFKDLDLRLDGGLERETLTTIAARPGMGKTAMALALARNVSTWGSSLFLSMEMSADQVNDRNVAALGAIPVAWLKKPSECDSHTWNKVTSAFQKAQSMNMHIDDQTGLNMLEIRSKARSVKRRHGLDLLVIDQLSFITGGSAENKAYEIGEYTRGLLALAKELSCAVVLLAQLNRECEKRNNKRPILSDLASSGSIEQDSANIIFLYRDEMYDECSPDKGVCEVIVPKQRQGEPGTVALTYIGAQTRFEDLHRSWQPPKMREPAKSRGFD